VEELNPNLPTPRQAAILRPPNRRHRASQVDRASRAHGEVNTVAMPWVDFGQDVAAILNGSGLRNGNHFIVNEREYFIEGGGRLCPVSGSGLVQLGRDAYYALGWYNDLGLTEAVEAQLDRDRVFEAERERARDVWRALQAWRRGQR
jgi:hypothetical protein